MKPRIELGEVNRTARAAVAATVVLTVAACSSPSSNARSADALGSGSARVTIGDGSANKSDAVTCESLGATTRISIGRPAAGVSLVVDEANKLVAREVTINDLDGFTGSYWEGLQGNAGVEMVGQTYRIMGTALGFSASTPTKLTTERFSVEVAC